MAVTTYSFEATSEQLNSFLHFALTFVLVPDLCRVDMPGMTLQLDLLVRDGSCGDEDGTLQIDVFPVGPINEAELFIVTYREFLSNVSQAGLFTPKEFYQGICDELIRQVEQHPEWKEKAKKLTEKFKLDRFEGSQT